MLAGSEIVVETGLAHIENLHGAEGIAFLACKFVVDIEFHISLGLDDTDVLHGEGECLCIAGAHVGRG